MKIKIAYKPEEARAANTVSAMVRQLLGTVKVKSTDQGEEYRHIYIATKEGRSKKNQKAIDIPEQMC